MWSNYLLCLLHNMKRTFRPAKLPLPKTRWAWNYRKVHFDLFVDFSGIPCGPLAAGVIARVKRGTGVTLTTGKTPCTFINSMSTWFERAESVFFGLPQLSVLLTYGFKSALGYRCFCSLLRVVLIYWAAVQTPASLGLPNHPSVSVHVVLSIFSPLTFQTL